ncbi:MAG TPA: PAS domain S-box protein [Stellaceae bacterium]|nr:PAS domain S-box protein [Stellaceae bacterium]
MLDGCCKGLIMDIASGQLRDQNSWSRYASVLWLSCLIILFAAAVSLAVFQFMPAVNEPRFVSLLQFGWLGYGLGLTALYLTYIHREHRTRTRTGRVTRQRSDELTEIRNLLTAEIEARRQAEARLLQNHHELKESESRYRTILETADSAIIVADQHGRIEQFNKAAEDITGYRAAEVIGENMRVLLPPNLRHEHYRYTARYLWTVRELEVCRKDGSLFAAELAIADWWAGGQRHFVGMLHDLTRQKREQLERTRLEEQLHQSQKMEAIGSLTGGMAHDFNNLLGIIIGNTDLLRDLEIDDPEADELTRSVLDAAFRGADLTRRLLAFARQQPLRPRRVDVNQLVSGIIRLLSRTLGENIEIALSLSSEVSSIIADPAQLEAAITNLANNARDAMPSGGHLAVATANCRLDADRAAQQAESAHGEYVMIELRDTGSGMTREVMNRIFEPFYTTKERDKGTGLGLSMVFGFITQSGGHVTVSSEPGVGTTFRLFLPRATEVVVMTHEDAEEQLIRGGGETILAVEDNDALRRVIVRQLNSLGYRVLEAKHADDALQLMELESIDVLLTDIVMPGGKDGVELARQARQRWPTIAVVFSSGFSQAKPDGDAISLPPETSLLSKPYRKENLACAVREALRRTAAGFAPEAEPTVPTAL